MKLDQVVLTHFMFKYFSLAWPDYFFSICLCGGGKSHHKDKWKKWSGNARLEIFKQCNQMAVAIDNAHFSQDN